MKRKTTLKRINLRIWAGAALIAGSAGSVVAGDQGAWSEITLQTGGGVPRVEQSFDLAAGPREGGAGVFSFQIGFTTAEVAAPGQLFDAFTLYVEDVALTRTALPVTLDASGAHWTPANPGGLSLAENAVVQVPVNWGGSMPAGPNAVSYDVTFTLPESLRDQPLHVTVSLFDNGNAAGSAGYFRYTVVPEPGTVALLGMAVGPLVWRLVRRARRAGSGA